MLPKDGNARELVKVRRRKPNGTGEKQEFLVPLDEILPGDLESVIANRMMELISVDNDIRHYIGIYRERFGTAAAHKVARRLGVQCD
jgi:hypothetical protein